MADVTITATENGPFLVRGPASFTDADGARYEIDRDTVALCRCGGSTNKPFCDGKHSGLGFEAAERAVAEADGGS